MDWRVMIPNVSVMKPAFCQSPNAKRITSPPRTYVQNCEIRRTSITPHRILPRCISSPPHITLPLIALMSMNRRIPTNFQNAPVSFMAASVLSNCSVLPESTFPDSILSQAPAALTLLLLHPSATPPKPKLLTAFLIGTAGTTLGAVIAARFVPNPGLAAAFAATYIGGTLNFVAVANALALPKEYIAAAMSVDLAAMTLYFGALFAIAARLRGAQPTGVTHSRKSHTQSYPKISSLLTPLLLTALIVAFTGSLSIPSTLNLLLTTALATAVSSIPSLQPFLSETPRLSTFALNLFFAALGASTRLSAVLSASPSVCAFAAIVLTVHAGFLYLVGSVLLRIPTKELILASNANVGGASTAAAFAASLGWRSLVHGAVAVGTLGYVVGTPIGLMIFRLLGGAA